MEIYFFAESKHPKMDSSMSRGENCATVRHKPSHGHTSGHRVSPKSFSNAFPPRRKGEKATQMLAQAYYTVKQIKKKKVKPFN